MLSDLGYRSVTYDIKSIGVDWTWEAPLNYADTLWLIYGDDIFSYRTLPGEDQQKIDDACVNNCRKIKGCKAIHFDYENIYCVCLVPKSPADWVPVLESPYGDDMSPDDVATYFF